MFSLLTLFACGSVSAPNGGDDYPADGTPFGGDGSPWIALETPAPGSFLGVGNRDVSGVAVDLSNVTVAGNVTSASGPFVSQVDLPMGMTTLIVEGTTKDGKVLSDSGSVLAGDFVAAEGIRRQALQAFVSDEGIQALVPMIGDLLNPDEFTAQLLALNPIVDSPEAVVNLTDVYFDPAQITVTPVQGALELGIVLPNFVLGIEATIPDVFPFGIDLVLEPDLEATEVRMDTKLFIEPDGQGGLDVYLGALEVDLVDFNLDTGILELIDWLFLDDEDLAIMLENQLSGASDLLQPTIDEMLGALDELDMELDLLGIIVTVAPSFDDVVINPSGVGIELGVAIDAVGATSDVPGHLTLAAPPMDGAGEVSLQISDDFMNRMLFELWAAGALDIDLDMDATTLFLFGGNDTGTLSLRAALPPVWIEKGGVARLQLGEISLTAETPGGEYGDLLEIVMALDAKADLELTGETFGFVLSDASVHMRATGDSLDNEALVEFLPGMSTAFGIGIGVVNELLTFPLTDLLGEGLVLPEIAFERDPSGLGTAVQLSVDDLLPLLGLGDDGSGTGSTPYGYPYGLDIQVPATATVHDQDATLTTDGDEGWICSRDDVETTGDQGTWYLEDNAELIIGGTNHTVYATDGSDVRLDTPGNIVYADPGASIDDRDGTNTIIDVDPLTLDLSNAPSPGC